MKLKNNLYKIEKIDREGGRVEISLIPDCEIYKAHFPEEPITPGVCIIQTASELLEEIKEEKLQLKKVANAKFLAVISPREDHLIIFQFKKIEEQDNQLKTSLIVTNKDGKIFSKISLEFVK